MLAHRTLLFFILPSFEQVSHFSLIVYQKILIIVADDESLECTI